MTDDPAKLARFPYTAALLCAACLGAAVWTWMQYSHAWDVTVNDFRVEVRFDGQVPRRVWNRALMGKYVRLRGDWTSGYAVGPDGQAAAVHDSEGNHALVCPSETAWQILDEDPGKERDLIGRVVSDYIGSYEEPQPVLDVSRGRLHGASVAGLVVGAMGIFVFTVALRHWLGERRTFREEAGGHNTRLDTGPASSAALPGWPHLALPSGTW